MYFENTTEVVVMFILFYEKNAFHDKYFFSFWSLNDFILLKMRL